MDNHNCLIIKPRATDYLAGDGNIPLKSNVPSGDWSTYLDFYERQRTDTYDTNGCVCFSAQEDFDAQMEMLIASGAASFLLPQFTALGYMDTGLDGQSHFHSSPRFIQIMTGNGFNGNSCQDAWDAMRQYGILPWKDLPFDDSVLQADYLNPPNLPALKTKANQFIDLIGGRTITGKSANIQYHWIVNDSANNLPAMTTSLQQAPLCLGINVGTDWNIAQPIPPVPGGAPGHCVMNYAIDNFVEVYDHYIPVKKDLAKIWPMPYVLQGVLTITPPVVIPPLPAPLPPQPTPTQEQTWLQKVSAWIQAILNQLQ